MAMTRRNFLNTLGTGGAILVMGSALYLDDSLMDKPKMPDGKILFDMHTHISPRYLKPHNMEAMLARLDGGITGLATSLDRSCISYSHFLSLRKYGVSIDEIDRGMLARFSYREFTGYVAHVQEVNSDYHILGLGHHGLVHEYRRAEDSIAALCGSGAATVAAHPYLEVIPGSLFGIRVRQPSEHARAYKIGSLCNEIETANGSCRNIVPFFAWMAVCNKLARKDAERLGYTGSACSDSHGSIAAVLSSGNAMQADLITMADLSNAIRNHQFQPIARPVSKWAIFINAF